MSRVETSNPSFASLYDPYREDYYHNRGDAPQVLTQMIILLKRPDAVCPKAGKDILIAAKKNHQGLVAALLKIPPQKRPENKSGWHAWYVYAKEGVKKGKTALHYAVLNNNLEMFQLLLQYGADVDMEDENSETPLDLACKSNKAFVLAWLKTPNITCPNAGRYILFATINNDTEMLRLLLQNRADPNALDEAGNTALHLAVIHNHLQVLSLLLQYKLDPNIKNKAGKTALDLAHDGKKRDFILALLKTRGICCPNAGNYILSAAADNDGDLELVTAYLRVPESQRPENDGHPWDSSWFRGRLSTTPDEKPVNPGTGDFSLHFAVKKGNLAMVQLFLQHKANPNLEDPDGNTAVHLAVIYDNLPILNLLLEYPATDPNRKNKKNKTAVELALDDTKKPLYSTLLRVSNIICPNAGTYVLDAAKTNDLELATTLLQLPLKRRPESGAWDSWYFPKKANCAIHCAVEYGNHRMVDLLLAAGASPNRETSENHTPLTIAIGRNDLLMVLNLTRIPDVRSFGDQQIWKHKNNKPLITQYLSLMAQIDLEDAIKAGCLSEIKTLLTYDLLNSALPESGRTPINLALEYGQLDIVVFLLDCGATLTDKADQLIPAGALDLHQLTHSYRKFTQDLDHLINKLIVELPPRIFHENIKDWLTQLDKFDPYQKMDIACLLSFILKAIKEKRSSAEHKEVDDSKNYDRQLKTIFSSREKTMRGSRFDYSYDMVSPANRLAEAYGAIINPDHPYDVLLQQARTDGRTAETQKKNLPDSKNFFRLSGDEIHFYEDVVDLTVFCLKEASRKKTLRNVWYGTDDKVEQHPSLSDSTILHLLEQRSPTLKVLVHYTQALDVSENPQQGLVDDATLSQWQKDISTELATPRSILVPHLGAFPSLWKYQELNLFLITSGLLSSYVGLIGNATSAEINQLITYVLNSDEAFLNPLKEILSPKDYEPLRQPDGISWYDDLNLFLIKSHIATRYEDLIVSIKDKENNIKKLTRYVLSQQSNEVLTQLKAILDTPTYDHLRTPPEEWSNLLTENYVLIREERVLTNRSYAKLEKSFALKMIQNAVRDKKSMEEAQQAVRQLCESNPFIKNNRTGRWHTLPSDSSTFYSPTLFSSGSVASKNDRLTQEIAALSSPR